MEIMIELPDLPEHFNPDGLDVKCSPLGQKRAGEWPFFWDGKWVEAPGNKIDSTIFFCARLVPKPRWRARRNCYFWYWKDIGILDRYKEIYTEWSDALWESGNYFSTEEEGEESPLGKAWKEMKEQGQ